MSLAGIRYYLRERSKRIGSYGHWLDIAKRWSAWGERDYGAFADRQLSIIANAAAETRFYSTILDDLRTLNRDTIHRIPLLTKDAARHSTEAIRRTKLLNTYRKTSTGGTSGKPLTLYQSLRGLQGEQAFFDEMWSKVGFAPASRLLVLRGGSASGALVAAGSRMVLPASSLTPDLLVASMKRIVAFRPEYLHCYPSTGISFARALEKLGALHDLSLRGIFCGSEAIYDHQVSYLEEAFGCPVVAWYGHSEQGALAWRERDGSYWFNPAYGFVELIEDEGNRFEIVTTGWLNDAMPLLRYRTGDLVEGAEWIRLRPDSAPVLRVERIVGREQEMFLSHDGKRVPFNHLIFGVHGAAWQGVEDFQFVQSAPGEIEMRIEVAVTMKRDATSIAKELDSQMTKRFASLATVRVVVVESIGRGSGKRTYFAPNAALAA